MVVITSPFIVERAAASATFKGILRSMSSLVTAGAVALIRDETLTKWPVGRGGYGRMTHADNIWEREKITMSAFEATRLPVCCIFFCGSGRNGTLRLRSPSLD